MTTLLGNTQDLTRDAVIRMAVTPRTWRFQGLRKDPGNWTFGMWMGSAGVDAAKTTKFGIEFGPFMWAWEKKRWID